ncbi:hypothetical protein [Roseomonas sp. BN140053]|uniref:hypothetical protein n=1 Tax=Roseomonas sp. BN140053 TaxID=3391898 RepID=UPI0039ECFE2C
MTDTSNRLVIQPMQWACLPELHETAPLDDSDHACMVELRAVLARHGKLGRFALHLAHRHFELAPGEVLIERPDPDGRTQHVTAGRLDHVPDAVPTTWLFEDGPDMLASGYAGAIYCVCTSDSPYAMGACAFHGKSNSPGPAQQREEEARRQQPSEEEKAKPRRRRIERDDQENER